MFLHKRKTSGRWYLVYRDETGKQRSISTRQKTKSDALLFLKSFKENEREKQRRIQNISFADFKKEYLEYSKSIHTANSHISARGALNEFEKIIGDVPLSKISIKDVENFIAVKKKKSVFTARRCFVTCAAAFKKAVDWNYLSVNVFNKVQKPKTPEVTPLYFNKDEFKKLLAVIDTQGFREFVTVAVLSGMRLSELINMRWEHVDLIGKQISVVNSDEFQTKSKKSRKIPMNYIMYETLARRKETAVTDYVFHKNMRKLDRQYISKRFKKCVLAAELNPKLHFHSLRHTCASWLVQSGVSLYVVQQILGHSNISVTEKYSHLEKTQLSEAVNKLAFEPEHAQIAEVSEQGVTV